ncbi:MAG: carboxypeptidase-like regulatory domain-containing protein [Candidatus Cyclobacteriaceae bacterium M3_2C_046]
MKLKHFKLFVLMAVVAIFGVTSCQDEFSEEDFLQLQADLAEQKASADHTRDLAEIAALHQNALALQDDQQAHTEAMQLLAQEIDQAMQIWMATEFDSIQDAEALDELRRNRLIFSYTVNVYEGGSPVEGVAVSINNQVQETTAGRTVADTTDASGSVTFNNVAVGTATVRLSKDGYIPASYQVDFYLSGATGDDAANEFRTEYSDVPLFALSSEGSSTGTIRGRVTVETNLTNETPEVPEGIMIRADFSDLSTSGMVQESDDIDVYNYVLQSSTNIGQAEVGEDGLFEMVVPASTAGQRINLVIPTFTEDQVLAITEKEGEMVEAQYDTIPVLFGPSVDESDIPEVSGAKAVFPEPTATGGTGLAFNVAKLAAGLGMWTDTNPLGENDYNGGTAEVGYDYQLLTRGADYETSPTITLAGGEGTGAEILASLEGYFSSLTLTDAGEGYTASSNGWAYIYFDGINDDGDTIQNYVNQVQITTDADGKVEAFGLADLWSSEGDPNNTNPILTHDYGDEGYRVIKWYVEVDGPGAPTTDATASVDVDMKIDAIKMYKGGSGYTSAPTVTFSGGGASEQATFEFSDFETHWVVSLDNTNSEGYTMLPADIYYEYFPEDGDPDTDDDIYPVEAGEVQSSENIEELLEVEGDSIAWKIPAKTYVTQTKSTEAPNFIVVDQTSFPAMMGVEVTDGKVTDLFRYNNNDTNSDGYYDAYGNGYGSPFSVQIMPAFNGAPGSGAKIKLLFGDVFDSGEYQWDGDYEILNPGSGYLENLNVASKENFNTSSISSSGAGEYYVEVSPGETITVEINYGTGEQLVEVDGE